MLEDTFICLFMGCDCVLQDVPSAETSCVEHNSKRRRVKSKKGENPLFC